MLKVSCVSYLNASPFVYGMQAQAFREHIRLRLEPPAQCAASFAAGRVDAALIPVGALGQLEHYQIVTEYCIGALESVYSVCLFANQRVELLNSIYLDTDSRTSSKLLHYLTQEYWHITPNFVSLPALRGGESRYRIPKTAGCLLIGDKTFAQHRHFDYIYDLASAWNAHTGLPFVFAVWIARTGVDKTRIAMLNTALALGTGSIADVASQWQPFFTDIDVLQYLTANIDYNFDSKKREAMHLFLRKVNK